VELLRPSSLAELAELGDTYWEDLFLAGGTDLVPLMREGLVAPERLVDVREVVPRGVRDGVIGAGTTLAELEIAPDIPDALREACRLAASPQLRNMGSLGGNLLQATRCWYWRLGYNCRLHGGDRCHAREGEHREHAIFANDFCASAHPSDIAAALIALGARLKTNRREMAIEELYRLPDEANRATTTLEDGELILEVELPEVAASVYLKAMDRKRWAFPQVGVAVAKVGGETRIALAGVAPIPWRISRIEDLDSATPLPRTEWKLPLARALVKRAVTALG
jgi:xanthine dehydrogenase YagS FAD-binding subunit